MSEISFIFNGISTTIQFMDNETIASIIQRYCSKIEKDINSLFFLYNGIVINEDLKNKELINKIDKTAGKMKILVYNKNDINTLGNEGKIKSKSIICPKCNKICLIKIKDYKLILYGCQNKHHNDIILLSEFENSQIIDETKIICNNCSNNKYYSYNKQFFKCFSCGQNLCPLCKSNHDNSHKIINYDEINYRCSMHNDFFISYCDICKINLCMLCQKMHNNEHNYINFIDIIENENSIKEELNVFKTKIDRFNNEIKNFIDILNNVTNNINIFYSINNDILTYYDKTHKNYEILLNISEIKNNIKSVDIDIDDIINENNNYHKINKILNLSYKMEKGIDKYNNEFEINNATINELKNKLEIKEKELKQKDKEIYKYLMIENELKKVKEELEKEKNNNKKIIIENNKFNNNLKLKELQIEKLMKKNNDLEISNKNYQMKMKELENKNKEMENEIIIQKSKLNEKTYEIKNNNNIILETNEKNNLKKSKKSDKKENKKNFEKNNNEIKKSKQIKDKERNIDKVNKNLNKEIKEDMIKQKSENNYNQELIDTKKDNKFKMERINDIKIEKHNRIDIQCK